MEQQNVPDFKDEMKMEEESIPLELIKTEIKKEEDNFLIKSEVCSNVVSQLDCPNQESALLQYQWVHLNKNAYIRFECSYNASNKTALISNQQTDTTEKPYKCYECSYSSSKTSNLLNHQMTHTGEKPYKCSECSYSSSRKSHLAEHQMTHTGERPYKCSECSYSTGWKAALVRHQRTHAGEIPYKLNLVRHQMLHTDEKPYQRNNSHLFHESRQDSNFFQKVNVQGPIFVKPLPFVKPFTFVKPVNFADPFRSSSSLPPSSFSSNQPESHKSHPAAPLTFSPGESVFTPAPTVLPTYSTTFPSPSHISCQFSDHGA